MAEDWDCEAYGPEGREAGALCFFTAEGRVCADPAECHRSMHAERQRVFGLISEQAAAGDELAVFLLEGMSGPEELLGGSSGD